MKIFKRQYRIITEGIITEADDYKALYRPQYSYRFFPFWFNLSKDSGFEEYLGAVNLLEQNKKILEQ